MHQYISKYQYQYQYQYQSQHIMHTSLRLKKASICCVIAAINERIVEHCRPVFTPADWREKGDALAWVGHWFDQESDGKVIVIGEYMKNMEKKYGKKYEE